MAPLNKLASCTVPFKGQTIQPTTSSSETVIWITGSVPALRSDVLGSIRGSTIQVNSSRVGATTFCINDKYPTTRACGVKVTRSRTGSQNQVLQSVLLPQVRIYGLMSTEQIKLVASLSRRHLGSGLEIMRFHQTVRGSTCLRQDLDCSTVFNNI